jgi:hypothetical protein
MSVRHISEIVGCNETTILTSSSFISDPDGISIAALISTARYYQQPALKHLILGHITTLPQAVIEVNVSIVTFIS